MASYRYPLGEHHIEMLRTATGLSLDQITLEAVLEGLVSSGDLTISDDTLIMQAIVAEEAGYPQLAENLRRAAELVRVPEDRILEIYTLLRPHRSTHQELLTLADELEQHYEAESVAALVREAADAYRIHGLLRETKDN